MKYKVFRGRVLTLFLASMLTLVPNITLVKAKSSPITIDGDPNNRKGTVHSPEKPLPWLHVDGRWIKDEEGNIVLLRGCNYMGAEFGWFQHQESDYARMKSWGFNVVRQPIAWSYVEPSRGYYDESYLEYVDQLVGWCKKYGLYMVLDMHQWHWSPKFGWFEGGLGNGLPEWTVCQWSTEEEAKVGFLNNETLKGYFYDMWEYVAARYANESTIAAYDLFNEANPPYLADVIYDFYNKTIEAIRTVDSKHILMYMPPWGHEYPYQKINQPNLIFSTHLYTGLTWDGVTGYNGDITKLEADMYRGYSKAVLEWNMPLWVGEFGIGSAATRAANWTWDMLSLMDKYMIGSVWWTYWRDDEYFGLLYTNGAEKKIFTSILDRPYPMLSSAEPSKFSYEKSDYIYNFSITFQPSGAETIWTTLHVPQFIENFTVSSNASEWGYSWDAENRVVNVTMTSETPFEMNLDSPASAVEEAPLIPWTWIIIAVVVILVAVTAVYQVMRKKRAQRELARINSRFNESQMISKVLLGLTVLSFIY